MFCSHCGHQMKDGSKFCDACGASVADMLPEEAAGQPQASASAPTPLAGTGAAAGGAPAWQQPVRQPMQQMQAPEQQPFAAAPQQAQRQTTFAQQMDADRKRSRRRLSSVAIIALVLSLVAGVALAAVLVYNFVIAPGQGNDQQPSEPPAATQPADEQEPEQEAELTEEQKVIKSLDGWWYTTSLPGGAAHPCIFYYFDNGTIIALPSDDYKTPLGTDSPDIDKITGIERTKLEGDGLMGDYKRHGGEEGYLIHTERDWGGYLFDNDKDAIITIGTAEGTRYRLTDPEALKNLETVNLTPFLGSDGNAAAKPAQTTQAAPAVDPTVAANQAKVDAAVSQGKQVIAGTVHYTTNDEAWKMLIGVNPNDDPNYSQRDADWYQQSLNRPTVLFVFDQPVTIRGLQYDAGGYKEQSASEGGFGRIGGNMGIDLPDSFASYDGQHVVMAFAVDEVSFPTDVSRIKATGGEVLFAGDSTGVSLPSGAANTANVSSSSYSGDYVLPESATRVYPVSEIRGMNLTKDQLRIARNEIFARHGRGFNDAGLQSYFNSKSWYTKRFEPGSFEEGQLSDIERQNIDNIKAVEG